MKTAEQIQDVLDALAAETYHTGADPLLDLLGGLQWKEGVMTALVWVLHAED